MQEIRRKIEAKSHKAEQTGDILFTDWWFEIIAASGGFKTIWKTVRSRQRWRPIVRTTCLLTNFLEKKQKFRYQTKPFVLPVRTQLCDIIF